MKTFKRSLYLLSLSLFIFTHAHAERDLNSVLNGTYASTEVWICDNGLQLTAAGRISFDGQGNAVARGNAGAFFPYECTYSYEVHSDLATCVSNGSTPVDCDLKYSGRCEVDIIGVLPNQVWYGNIGHRGNGFTGNGNTAEVILVQRQDGASEIPGVPESGTCAKIGTLVKINDFFQNLLEE